MLDQVLSALPRVRHPDVLVGFDTADDAGVYRLTPSLALVQTVDFFTPIVDDPEQFGAIAAANSLSDVYAMGGVPITALSVLAWPQAADTDVLRLILQGGAAKLTEASCVLLGGHSVNDPEIKFGYAVTGTVHPDRIWTNSGAQPGDYLILTKPIGTGVLATAAKQALPAQAAMVIAIESMMQLNSKAAESAAGLEVHACTDITGFGLLGHAREMALGSSVTLLIDTSSVPLFPQAVEFADAGAIPQGLRNNREFIAPCLGEHASVPSVLFDLLHDPQTSGGLLLSLSPSVAVVYLARNPNAHRIGEVLPKGTKPILLK